MKQTSVLRIQNHIPTRWFFLSHHLLHLITSMEFKADVLGQTEAPPTLIGLLQIVHNQCLAQDEANL
jgi:hypothetical protein